MKPGRQLLLTALATLLWTKSRFLVKKDARSAVDGLEMRALFCPGRFKGGRIRPARA